MIEKLLLTCLVVCFGVTFMTKLYVDVWQGQIRAKGHEKLKVAIEGSLAIIFLVSLAGLFVLSLLWVWWC